METRSLYTRLLAGLLTLLGFASCGDDDPVEPDLYGCPIDTTYHVLYGVPTVYRSKASNRHNIKTESLQVKHSKSVLDVKDNVVSDGFVDGSVINDKKQWSGNTY